MRNKAERVTRWSFIAIGRRKIYNLPSRGRNTQFAERKSENIILSEGELPYTSSSHIPKKRTFSAASLI